MNILDSRRLTGPGLMLDGPGAVLDVRLEEPETDRAIAAWQNATRRLLHAVGWQDETLASRGFPGGISLALSAPIDGLYAATELNERAWAAAAAELRGEKAPDFRAAVAGLLDDIENERNPALVGLYREARARGLTFLHGEDLVSAGSGTGALLWRVDDLPDPASVDWTSAHEIPITLVTGSNGKTTVVRLLAAMVEAAGKTTGTTSTDGVMVGDTLLEEGDFSGPSGARMVLRHAEVEMAILETARGGILRRGLPVDRADVAVITNIADDHLGEFGVESLPDLATTKLLVAKVLGNTGRLVLNADDPLLVERSRGIPPRIIWFSLDSGSPQVARHLANGGTAVVAEAGMIVLAQGNQRVTLASVAAVPITFGGTAKHNVANALAAAAGAAALGIGVHPIAEALQRFGRDLEDNPGRTNLLDLGGVRILLDFAHNPHGMSALVDVARTLPAQRRVMLIGQAGDRSDEAIRALARAAWELQPDHVVVKDMTTYLRGRPAGEVPQLLAAEFSRLGLPEDAISWADGEIAGVRVALEWARPGDLLILAVHQDRPAVLDLLEGLKAGDWRAGDSLPGHVARA
jgi:UDP-N-acetylmuramyl tripeptide synthase